MPTPAASLRHPRISGKVAAAKSSPPPRLELLDGFALWVEECLVPLPLHVQRLLAFLALEKRPLHRAYVSGRLWPALTQEHAFASLRTTLWRTSGHPSRLVQATSSHLALAPAVAVDSHAFESRAEAIVLRARAATPGDLGYLVHTGELLPDWYDCWVLPEREQLRELRILALEAAADELITAHSYPEAAMAALAAVRADPLRDSAARLLIRCHLAEGNLAEALRQFRLFRARLARDLGLEPSRQMLELVRGIPTPAMSLSPSA